MKQMDDYSDVVVQLSLTCSRVSATISICSKEHT
jgi:hypothetical protein